MSGSVLDRLGEVFDELARTELGSSDDVRALLTASARIDAVTARTVARWDANNEYAADNAKTPAAWLAAKCGIAKPHAQRILKLGRACRQMPAASAAWLDGRVHAEQVSVLAGVRHIDTFERDEQLLVDHAQTMRFDRFVKAVDYWRLRNDPDDADHRAQKQIDDRRFDCSKTFQNTWIGDFVLDPISGEILDITMRTIEHQLWQADWTEAKQRLGRDPLPHELRRTPKQRRADALVEMAIRARVAPENGKRPEPLFTVLCGYQTFQALCELASGSALTPSQLIPYLEHSWVERIVFESPSRAIDVGAHRRLFTGATREAVKVRDRECFEDTCDEPAWRCQVDHIHEWNQGGPTIQTNGRLACGFHNRLRNKKRKPNAE